MLLYYQKWSSYVITFSLHMNNKQGEQTFVYFWLLVFNISHAYIMTVQQKIHHTNDVLFIFMWSSKPADTWSNILSVAQSLVFAYLFIFVYSIKIHSLWILLSGIQGI